MMDKQTRKLDGDVARRTTYARPTLVLIPDSETDGKATFASERKTGGGSEIGTAS